MRPNSHVDLLLGWTIVPISYLLGYLMGEPGAQPARSDPTEELANSDTVYWAHRLPHLLRPLLTAG
jgi:hypothetical protein